MKIYITGSSGHLGEALCKTLSDKGIEFVGVDIIQGQYTNKIGSITDREFIKKTIAGSDYIIHTATLHKPHVATHSKQDFVDTNISGTLVLLEEAKHAGAKGFIFTSTTSTFGDAMHPQENEPADWVTEETVPISKNIYGVTKIAAENLCQLFARNHQLPCLVLKTSRFFLESDDNRILRTSFEDLNIKANEFLNRRVDVEDIVSAHLLALEKVEKYGFRKYIISATPPFSKGDLNELNQNAPAIVARIFPEFKSIYEKKNWQMFSKIGRVYVNEKARKELNWNPRYNYAHVLKSLKNGKDFFSPLAREVGSKGYHDEVFGDGPYPVEDSDILQP